MFQIGHVSFDVPVELMKVSNWRSRAPLTQNVRELVCLLIAVGAEFSYALIDALA